MVFCFVLYLCILLDIFFKYDKLYLNKLCMYNLCYYYLCLFKDSKWKY